MLFRPVCRIYACQMPMTQTITDKHHSMVIPIFSQNTLGIVQNVFGKDYWITFLPLGDAVIFLQA